MKAHRFDTVAQIVGGALSRRRAGAVLLTTTLAALGLPNGVSAACKKVGRNCDKNKDCCNHAECKSKKCRCKNGFTNCADKCLDLDADEQRCGGCNNVCAAGERCCNGNCVDLDSSDNNCGACNAACPETQECVAGECVTPPGGCAAGQSLCLTGDRGSCAGDANCVCQQSVEGRTVCVGGVIAGVFCGCNSSAGCADQLGPTAVCVAGGDGDICCGPDLPNICRLPCPSL